MDDFLYAVYEQAINDIDLTMYNNYTRPQVWWDIKGLKLPIQLNKHSYSEKKIDLINSLSKKADIKLGLDQTRLNTLL